MIVVFFIDGEISVYSKNKLMISGRDSKFARAKTICSKFDKHDEIYFDCSSDIHYQKPIKAECTIHLSNIDARLLLILSVGTLVILILMIKIFQASLSLLEIVQDIHVDMPQFLSETNSEECTNIDKTVFNRVYIISDKVAEKGINEENQIIDEDYIYEHIYEELQ